MLTSQERIFWGVRAHVNLYHLRKVVQSSSYKGGLDLRAKFLFILNLNQNSTHFIRHVNLSNMGCEALTYNQYFFNHRIMKNRAKMEEELDCSKKIWVTTLCLCLVVA